MKYKEEFTGLIATEEEWYAAYVEFLLENANGKLPLDDVLRWDYGLAEVK